MPNEVDNLLFFSSLSLFLSALLFNCRTFCCYLQGGFRRWRVFGMTHRMLNAFTNFRIFNSFVRLLIESIIYLSHKQFNTTQEKRSCCQYIDSPVLPLLLLLLLLLIVVVLLLVLLYTIFSSFCFILKCFSLHLHCVYCFIVSSPEFIFYFVLLNRIFFLSFASQIH